MADHTEFKFFLSCYWNQTADLVYDNIYEAFRRYSSNLNEDDIINLKNDILKLKREGVFPLSYSLKSRYHSYWKDFDRVVLEEEIDQLLATLSR